MRIIRLYTGEDSESHFEEIDLLSEMKDTVEASVPEATTGIFFRRAPTGHVQDWHPAPRRQYVITLSGEGEIQVGDGTVRRFGPGDIVLADDTTGRGHITRVVGKQPRFYATIPLK
ncbi:MAG: hypothetical protein ACE5HC_13375 [Candidatus Binatia bacterium]